MALAAAQWGCQHLVHHLMRRLPPGQLPYAGAPWRAIGGSRSSGLDAPLRHPHMNPGMAPMARNFQNRSTKASGGRWQIPVNLCAGVLQLSAMTATKHDAMCGSATGRRGAADERRGRGRAGTMQFFRREPIVVDPSLQVVNTKRAGVLMVSAHACCFTQCYHEIHDGSNLNLLANDHCPTPDAE